MAAAAWVKRRSSPRSETDHIATANGSKAASVSGGNNDVTPSAHRSVFWINYWTNNPQCDDHRDADQYDQPIQWTHCEPSPVKKTAPRLAHRCGSGTGGTDVLRGFGHGGHLRARSADQSDPALERSLVAAVLCQRVTSSWVGFLMRPLDRFTVCSTFRPAS